MTVDWSEGRYETFAEQLLPAARAVVALADPQPGERVLDVGCGTGNAALLAAERGAAVTGVDPAARLLVVAAARAAQIGVAIDLLAGEAAALPVPDAAYDVVLSVFAAVFAPDPPAVLAELARVTAPGGRILMTAWLPGGAVGEANAVMREALQQAAGGPPAAGGFAWHDVTAVRSLAASLGLTVEVEEQSVVFTAASPEAYLDSEGHHHPVAVAARRVLEPRGRLDETLGRMLDVLRAGNEDPDGFRARSRYLVFTMRRA